MIDKEYLIQLKKQHPNAKKIKCPGCGTEVYDFYNFCDKCGYKLNIPRGITAKILY